MKKAGKALSKADVDTLTKKTQFYMAKGDTHIVAATKAVEDLVRSAQKTVLGYEKEITDKGGDVQANGFSIEDEISFAKGEFEATGLDSKLDKMIAKKTTKPIKVKREMSEDEVFTEFMDKEGFTEDEAAVIKKGGFGTQSVGERAKKRVLKINKNAKTKFRQAVVDQYASFKELMGDERSWMLSHLTSSAPGAIEATMHHGQPKLDKSGVITVDTKKKSLDQVLEQLGPDLDKWTYWMAGNRSNRLLAEGKENLFVQADVDVLMGLNKGKEKLFEKVRQDFEELNNAVVKIAVDSGLVNAEEAEQWAKEGFYLPFYRVMDDDVHSKGPRALGKAGLVRQQAFKKLKGGEAQLADLMTNAVLNWNHLISASLKNQAAASAMNTAVELGAAVKVSVADKSKDAVFIREDGLEAWYEVSEPLVLESMMALNWDGLNGPVMDIMRSFKRALTIGVTASPEFKARNLIRDSVHAMAVTDASANIFKNLAMGFKATASDSDISSQMLASGASFGQSGYIHGSDPEAITKLVKKGMTEAQVKATILDTPAKLAKIWDAYQDFGARLENVNRSADYSQAIERGESLLKATFGSRDHLDFTRTGTSSAIRFIAHTVPFVNARLQGLDKAARAAPGTFKDWMNPKEAAKFKAVIGVYSLMSVAAYLAMKDDDDYKAAEEWEKRTYHLLKIPGNDTMFRIPRPFEVGAIAYLAESVAQQMADDKVHGVLFAERLGHTLTDTFAMNPIPQMFKPGGEIAMDKSMFTGRPIESQAMKSLSPESRKRAWTSETAIAMSETMADIGWGDVTLSPVQIEHLVRGYLGWAGATVLSATDMLITRPLTDAPAAPTTKFTEYPLIKAFVKTSPSKNTHYTTMFYTRLEEINNAYADINEAKKIKDFDKARELIDKNKDALKRRRFYNKARAKISKINQRMKLIRLSSQTADNKRAELDRLTFVKNELTKRVFDRDGR
tara:strand:+ start:1339 stop:4215 length:2877 start_codon:yes stop_codon:yes gene_type:complete